MAEIYDIGQEVGTGKYGTVRVAAKKLNPKKRYAIKSIERATLKKDIGLLEQELAILSSINHPNIISFYEIY